MVESARLEIVLTLTGYEGSNPSPSAMHYTNGTLESFTVESGLRISSSSACGFSLRIAKGVLILFT